jgi:hypothetical protein
MANGKWKKAKTKVTSLPLMNADCRRSNEKEKKSVQISVHLRKSAASLSLPFAICHLP